MAVRKAKRRGGEITLRNVHMWALCSDVVSAYLGEEQTVGKQGREGSKRSRRGYLELRDRVS